MTAFIKRWEAAKDALDDAQRELATLRNEIVAACPAPVGTVIVFQRWQPLNRPPINERGLMTRISAANVDKHGPYVMATVAPETKTGFHKTHRLEQRIEVNL